MRTKVMAYLSPEGDFTIIAGELTAKAYLDVSTMLDIYEQFKGELQSRDEIPVDEKHDYMYQGISDGWDIIPPAMKTDEISRFLDKHRGKRMVVKLFVQEDDAIDGQKREVK